VVPPNQSEMMADALRRKGRPVAYITFAGEQHGFRKAENIIRSLEAELYFYGAVFGSSRPTASSRCRSRTCRDAEPAPWAHVGSSLHRSIRTQPFCR
jgi:acetyl esterase/lipase